MDKIFQTYEMYSDIVHEFSEERIQERFQDFYCAYESFINKMNICDDVRINSYTLMHAILDYFTDISRLKKFHKIKHTNTFKIMAYELSWIIRRKPLQIIKDESEYNDRQKAEELVYINEKFVLSYIMSYFSQLVGYDFYETLNEKNKACIDGYIDSLFYYLKYRDCNSQTLEFALLSFGAGIAATNVKITFPEEMEY